MRRKHKHYNKKKSNKISILQFGKYLFKIKNKNFMLYSIPSAGNYYSFHSNFNVEKRSRCHIMDIGGPKFNI